LLPTALADLEAVAVDVGHILERVRIGRIEEADHVNKILEVGVERIVVGTRSDCVSPRLKIPLISSASAGP
jgi:ethanolamine ammonia-lyase small subunit